MDGAKCSCCHSDGSYNYFYNISFVNRCPHCGGSLAFEQYSQSYGISPGFTSVEGMWYCTSCDMDFCLVHGRSHDNMGYYLTPYEIPPPKPKLVVKKTPAEKFKELYNKAAKKHPLIL